MLRFRCEHCECDFDAPPDKAGHEQAPCASCGYLCMTVEFLQLERSRNRFPIPHFSLLLIPQFSLRTLLLAVTLLSIFFGLSVATRSYFCAVVMDGYVYGFPFPAVTVWRNGMGISVHAAGLLKNAAVFFLVLFVASRSWTWIASLKTNQSERP